MKNQKIRRICALMLAVPLSLAATSRAQDAPKTGVLIPGNTFATGDTFQWKFQPPIGLRGQYTMYTSMKMAQNIPAMPAVAGGKATPAQRFDIETQSTTNIDYEVVSRDTKGGTTSRLTYRAMKTNSTLKMNGKAIAAPDNAAQQQKTQKLFDGLTLQIKQGPDGHVWNIVGLDAMQRRLKSLAAGDAATAAMMKPFLDSVFSEKTLRQTWDTAANRPKNPISVGDSWNYTLPLASSLMNMELRGTRTLTDLNAERAVISDRANLSLKLDLPLGAPGALPASAQVQSSGGGVMTGNSIVNRATGMEIETHADQRFMMKTKVKMRENGRPLEMEIPQWFLVQTRTIFRPGN